MEMELKDALGGFSNKMEANFPKVFALWIRSASLFSTDLPTVSLQLNDDLPVTSYKKNILEAWHDLVSGEYQELLKILGHLDSLSPKQFSIYFGRNGNCFCKLYLYRPHRDSEPPLVLEKQGSSLNKVLGDAFSEAGDSIVKKKLENYKKFEKKRRKKRR
jgi:hypothetical protein